MRCRSGGRVQRSTDVIVAGGGPAGLAAAISARMAGLSVVLLEQRSGPIDKACGEGLMPSALRNLRELGVDVPEATRSRESDTSMRRTTASSPRASSRESLLAA